MPRKSEPPDDKPDAPAADWRVATLAAVRARIRAALPDAVEAQKWKKPTNPAGVPTWSQGGLICTGETYRDKIKLTFARGAALPDPAGLFNAGLDGNTRRAIDLHAGDVLDPATFADLLRAAAALNDGARPTAPAPSPDRSTRPAKPGRTTPTVDSSATGGPAKPATKPAAAAAKSAAAKPVPLLAGGNPQIAKGDGDAVVQAYLDVMPGWTRDVGRRVDALIAAAVPGVRRAVRWNSPFYGSPDGGWFVSFHVFTKYVKLTFFDGTALTPPPPGGSPKSKSARWLDVYETDSLDDRQLAAWFRQAAELPGWNGK